MPKTLVLYVFYDYNNRTKHFINKGIFQDENVDFVVISNNKNINFTVPFYVKKIIRDNIGYDFGGWSDALLKDNLYQNYENFIFVNNSVIGPFLNCNMKWTDIYINGLTDDVKLFGSTINTCKNPIEFAHVQSYIFAMNQTTLRYLIKCEIFSLEKYARTKNDAIKQKEILMSRYIIKNNWNIGSLLSYYKDVDFTFKNKKQSEYKILFLDDIMYKKYMNKLWTLTELVFIKGNRINYELP
tara:strand:+ start:788 stop:1510 length:723 start_codon:yes stop_codon:yes gene_type:complete